jgi:hypothetical protein
MARTVVVFKDRTGDKRSFHRKTRLVILIIEYQSIHQMNIMDWAGTPGKMTRRKRKNSLAFNENVTREPGGKRIPVPEVTPARISSPGHCSLTG